MYIRWIVRKHKNRDTANVTFHDAYLVESSREDLGVPRQRTVCYLGNIRQIGDEFPAIEREIFLLRAERILENEARVSPQEREQVLQLLRQRVPELTEDEVLLAFRNTLRWYYRWWRDHGGAPSPEQFRRYIESASETMDPL